MPIARSRRDRRFSRKPEGLQRPRDLEEIVARAKPCAGSDFNVIGTKRPASRDRFEGAVRQTHHMQGIEHPLRQIMSLFRIMKFEQIFSLQCQTEQATSQEARRKLFLRMTLSHLYSTPTRDL